MASPAVPEDTNMPRLHCLYMAKLANQAEQYNDMAKFMSEIITNHSANLTLEERTLFSGAYKKLVDSLRQACRIASFNEHEELGRVEEDRARMARLYGSLVGSQLAEVCAGVLDLLDTRLIPAVEVGEESEGKVYYMKMKGDYYRYLAEVKTGEERSMVVEKALHAYNAAEDIALAELAPIHPTRLGLAANFSLFYFEVLNLPDLACSMAKEAYKDAMAEIDNEDSYNQSTDLIMQLIRDNFNLWNSDEIYSSF